MTICYLNFMKTITEQLSQLTGLQLHNEGEWSNTLTEYSAFNDAGVESEVGEFLYSLVRLLKPMHVLETGTHQGIGMMYMGQALKDNGKGTLDTLEFLPPHHTTASALRDKLELLTVTCHLIDAASFKPQHNYDLILLDTEPAIRFAELVKYYPYLNEGGFIFIHDTPRNLCQGNINTDWPNFSSWPFGDIPQEMRELVTGGQLRPMHFPNPRGLTCFYKIHKDDVIW